MIDKADSTFGDGRGRNMIYYVEKSIRGNTVVVEPVKPKLGLEIGLTTNGTPGYLTKDIRNYCCSKYGYGYGKPVNINEGR